ncbi:MAG: PilN domain-containing protein [Gammaproteobacteria bacterium]
MPRINLLPWRAELRQKRKKEFFMALLGAVIVGGALVYLSKLTVQGWTSSQRGRNEILKAQIVTLDKQIEEIKGLKSQRERLLARMRVIDQLQRSRPEVVHLFDEIVNVVPEGVDLTDIGQAGARIELRGVAQSSTRVSALMRNIDGSKWMKDPSLDIVESVAAAAGADKSSKFKLFAQQIPMVTSEEGQEAAK